MEKKEPFFTNFSYCKVKKIEILYLIADELNVSEVFEEIYYHAT